MAKGKETKVRKPLLLSATAVMFVAIWLWAWLWYGDVLRMARESSFWSSEPVLMQYLEGRPWGALLWCGQLLLQLFRWPVLGGAVFALMLSLSTWLVGYCLRLRGWWRLLQFVPALCYLIWMAYQGFDLFFETETGPIMGIPLLATLVLLLTAVIIRSFSHSHHFPPIFLQPHDESPRLNHIEWAAVLLCIAIPMGITHWMRPDVRVVTRMQCQMMERDWNGMAETARKRPTLSYRPIAAYYAIALLHTGQLGSRLFDIRLDYDIPYMHGFNGSTNNATNYYVMDCDLAAGLVEPATHHAMEHMTMNGPTLRSLKMLTKCALLRGEWKVAEKYLRVLKTVPFEGEFLERYRPMVGNEEKVNADAELAMVRLTEPIHDSFENYYTQPVFLGYNAALIEGRSSNALMNSLMVHIYSKSMPQFLMRCQPIAGTTPPQSIAEALALMSSKYTQVRQMFPMILQYNQPRIVSFLTDVRPFMADYDTRKAHALELFPRWKGYYPYYYFFGNLKATRGHIKENEGTSNQGVN